jgi:hypothetical protein
MIWALEGADASQLTIRDKSRRASHRRLGCYAITHSGRFSFNYEGLGGCLGFPIPGAAAEVGRMTFFNGNVALIGLNGDSNMVVALWRSEALVCAEGFVKRCSRAFPKGGITVILILIGVFVGAMLGLRFKVFVLVPVICVALAIVAVGDVARGDDLWQLAISMIVIATSLQVGYFGGSVALGSAPPSDMARFHCRLHAECLAPSNR